MRNDLLVVFIAIVGSVTGPCTIAQVIEDQYFDSDGVRIRYIEKGEGEPLVLIHGFAANIDANWLLPGVFDKLAEGYRVIALDCRGHGKSDKPHDASQYGDALAMDVVRLLDHLKIEKAHLFGYSMGGMITFKAMTEHPERVISALPCGFGWGPPSEEDDRMLEALADALDEHGSIRPLMEFLHSGNEPISDEQIEQTDQMVRLMNDTKALSAVARGMGQLRPDEEKLDTNRVPALVIVGSDDPLRAAAETMVGRMKNLEVKLIEGGDHMSAFFDAGFFTAVTAFLEDHAAVAVK